MPKPSSSLAATIPATSPLQFTKRTRNDEDDDGPEVPEVRPVKKAKKRKARPGIQDQDIDLDLKRGLNLAIGKMDRGLLSDYIAQRIKRFWTDLSAVELMDLLIPESAIQDTSDWTQPRLLPNMPQFLDNYNSGRSKSLSFASKKLGAPHTLVVTSAGLRAADITRALRTFQTNEAMVAKLFARHIKLKDAIEFVKKTRMNFGVGTPSRLIDLFSAGALSFDKLERIVIDTSYIDVKKRGIFDMAETQKPLIQLLNNEGLKNRYNSVDNRVTLLLY